METRYNQSTRQNVAVQNPDGAGWTYAPAASGIVNSTAAVTIAAAPTTQPAGFGGTIALRNYLTGLQINNDVLGAATELAIRDGAGGTVLWRCKLDIAVSKGISHVFATPIRGSAGNLLEVVTLTASVTGGVFVNAQGYVGL